MTFLIIISFFIILYFLFNGLAEYLDASSQELEIKAKHRKVDIQPKFKELEKRIEQTIEKNGGWYTVDYLDDFVYDNVKKYKKE